MALVISACGSSAQSASQISTAVAQTVQAQDSLTRVAALPTLTPAAPIEVTVANDGAATNTPLAVVSAPSCTVSARLASENPPDGTLLKPGDTFLKTWSLENTGTCTWDTSYKLIYSIGDLMGGLGSYPLPVAVAPGETKDISIYLKAPDTEGSFTGYWLIQTPWNTYFGVGPNSEPFYVKIRVSSADSLKYGVTSVTYQIVRDPATGCPANVVYTVYATITTNGPLNLHYYWNQSDGNESKAMTLSFTEAGSQTVSREWKVGKGDSPNSRWMQIIATGPTPQEYDKATWPNNCP
jgi:hypothetical protein